MTQTKTQQEFTKRDIARIKAYCETAGLDFEDLDEKDYEAIMKILKVKRIQNDN